MLEDDSDDDPMGIHDMDLELYEPTDSPTARGPLFFNDDDADDFLTRADDSGGGIFGGAGFGDDDGDDDPFAPFSLDEGDGSELDLPTPRVRVAPDSNPGAQAAKSAKVATAAAYACAFALLGLSVASLGPALELLAEIAGADIHAVSVAFPVRSVGYFLGSLAGGGGLSKGIAANTIIWLSLALTALGLAVLPLCGSASCIAVVSSTGGFGMGVLDTAANAALVWLFGSGEVDPYMQFLHFSFGLGAFVSPLLELAWTRGVDASRLRAAYWTMAVAFVPVILWVRSRPSPRDPSTLRRTAGGRDRAGSEFEGAPLDPSSAGIVDGRREDERASRRAAWALWAPRAVVALVGTLLLLDVGAEVSYGGFITSFGHLRAKMSEKSSMALASVFWGSLAFGRLAAVALSAAKFAPEALLGCDLAGCVLALAILLSDRASSGTLYFSTFLYGVSMASVFPSALNLMARYVSVTGVVSTIVVGAASFGEALVPWIISNRLDEDKPASFDALPEGCLVVSLLSTVALILAVLVGRGILNRGFGPPAS